MSTSSSFATSSDTQSLDTTYFLGVDVGTGSARAALVHRSGKILSTSTCDILTWNPQPDYYEQSSSNIWAACVQCIRKVTKNIKPEHIKGIGFDATCSLVCLDENNQPLSVSLTENNEQNVILWMDHRASKEANKINSMNNSVLQYVGGSISLEMQTPKLIWLKTNLPETCWNRVGMFFDLPDFLTWKATRSTSRSLCSLICKWTYEIQADNTAKWNEQYFKDIGLDELKLNNWKKIGCCALEPGTPVGKGLCEEAAQELGLLVGTPVGTSIIDAHAGGLGLIGCSVPHINSNFNTRLCLISGTSTCYMVVSEKKIFVSGVWGPYYSAMVPGLWLNEGGQSATGRLIDYIINSHPITPTIKKKLGNVHVQQYLNDLLIDMAEKAGFSSISYLTSDLHVYPDFHGNRSPISDPTLKGSICGLSLSENEESLARIYLSTLQALAYGSRHIMESMIEAGHTAIESILICGGLSKNHLFVQIQADVLNVPVICPNESESVLLGASILGACAAGYFENIHAAIKCMGGNGTLITPNNHPNITSFHRKKYQVFLRMLCNQKEYRNIMSAS